MIDIWFPLGQSTVYSPAAAIMKFAGISFRLFAERSDAKFRSAVDFYLSQFEHALLGLRADVERQESMVYEFPCDEIIARRLEEKIARVEERIASLQEYKEISPPEDVKIWGFEEFRSCVVMPIDSALQECECSIYQEETIPVDGGILQWDLDSMDDCSDREELFEKIVCALNGVRISQDAVTPAYMYGDRNSALRIVVDLTKPRSYRTSSGS